MPASVRVRPVVMKSIQVCISTFDFTIDEDSYEVMLIDEHELADKIRRFLVTPRSDETYRALFSAFQCMAEDEGTHNDLGPIKAVMESVDPVGCTNMTQEEFHAMLIANVVIHRS